MAEFARFEDQGCFATREDVKQVEEFVQQFAVPADACRSMEEQWQLFSAQTNEKLEMIQQSCSTLDVSRDMEERLQSLCVLMTQKAEYMRESCVPLKTYRKLEDRFQSLSSQTDQKLEKFQNNQQHFAAECKTLSQEVQTLQKLNTDHSPRLAKLESRLDTEASNCTAKFNELGTSLKSKCLTCQELLAAEGATRKHEVEQLKMKVKQHDTAHADLAIAHKELTSLHRELSASYCNDQKMDTERLSQLEFLFEADRKLCMATVANAELGSNHI